jgi:hypothetical protein
MNCKICKNTIEDQEYVTIGSKDKCIHLEHFKCKICGKFNIMFL